MGNKSSSPLYNKISIGEDTSNLTFKPFSDALLSSGLLPKVSGNKFSEESHKYSMYNPLNLNHLEEMDRAKGNIEKLISLSYDFVETNYSEIYNKEKYFILSNRGTYAFICLIGSLNTYLIDSGKISRESSPEERFNFIKYYLGILCEQILNLSPEEEKRQLELLGAGANVKWLRFFQSLVNKVEQLYSPKDLEDWKERQNDDLQNHGRKLGVEIEKFIKKSTLSKLQALFGENWELEIGSIKRECVERALQEDERNYKEGISKEAVDWKDMFNINDYKTIIEKNWIKKPDISTNEFVTFEKEFSIDISKGFNSKSEKLQWISNFNSYRNLWAHEGTKEKRLNKEEVVFLEFIHSKFYKKS
ncbi:hypothetical protein AQBE111736_12265 [Aquirufa beregesia]